MRLVYGFVVDEIVFGVVLTAYNVIGAIMIFFVTIGVAIYKLTRVETDFIKQS